MPEPVGIIGLGRIGLAVAKTCLNDGRKTFGYDLSPVAREGFAAAGGITLESPEEVARRADVILVLVLNDDQVTEVITGKRGILKGTGSVSTIVCMSTINRDTLQSVASRCRAKNVAFVDCPFTGGPARIPSRSLTLIAAAPAEVLGRVRDILQAIGTIVHAGIEPGQGQAIKHCNQLLVGVTHAATMEVIILARKLGLDPALVTSVVASGIAGSDYFRLLAESVLKKTPSPGGLGQMCKDMDIVKSTLKETGMNAMVASAASGYFADALKLGMSDREGADLIEVVEQLSEQNENQD